MIRLGLHLALRGGRATVTRLLITTAAVAIGVALLLSALAIYHGYQTSIGRACWACTGLPTETGPPPDAAAPSTEPAAGAELWNYTEDYFRDRVIQRADVATLGPDAPVVPGLIRMPTAGEYAASPALARLIATTPPDQLGDRFPGTSIGTIGPAGLSGPDDLAIVVGHQPTELAARPDTMRITAIETAPRKRGDTVIYRFGFALGAVSLLLPMLILIGNATRLAAARREERFAAMRLVGATPRQVRIIASIEAVAGALLGAVLGAAAYAVALHPLVAEVSVTGDRLFADSVTPTPPGYLAVLIGVPLAAAAAALLSLRRVQISPLGVVRRATPPPPHPWRVVPFIVGLLVFIVPLAVGNRTDPNIALATLGLAVTMVGLMIGGSWLTMQAARLLSRILHGPASLLATRRMADNPRATYRSVSGVVLAVFVGTLLAGVVPAALAAQQTQTGTSLNGVLRLMLGGPQGPGGLDTDQLVDRLRRFDGVAVASIYSSPPTTAAPTFGAPPPGIVDCDSLGGFGPLGQCGPSVPAAEVDLAPLFTDNLAFLNRNLPLVTATSTAFTGDVSQLRLSIVLVNVDSSTTVERIRTFLTTAYPGLTGGSGVSPQTFGEVAAARASVYTAIGDVMLVVVGLTLLVAGCGLAIGMGAGVVERRRPFTLLRVSGAHSRVLRRVVLVESFVPLLTATLVAALAGLAASMPVNSILNAGAGNRVLHLPDATYYVTMGVGLVACLALIAATLPLLERTTMPANARFE